MTKKVLLPQPVADEARKYLELNGCEIITASDPEPETVIPLLKDADAVVLRTGIKFDRELIARAKNLKTISRTGGGVDNVDLQAATEAGILVTSSLGVNTSSVVEHCVALIFALYKQLHVLDREVRGNNFKIRYQNLPRDLSGKTLGVIGFGRIGSSLAKICHESFGMKILAFDAYMPEDVKAGFTSWADFPDIDRLFAESDVISLHIPLTPETQGMINNDVFIQMKNDALLINASRGGIVNEEDLAGALERGELGGAGLDVFSAEPIEPDNPLINTGNTILTPHTAALTGECVIHMAVASAERVIDVFEGRKPDSIANPAVLGQAKWSMLK